MSPLAVWSAAKFFLTAGPVRAAETLLTFAYHPVSGFHLITLNL